MIIVFKMLASQHMSDSIAYLKLKLQMFPHAFKKKKANTYGGGVEIHSVHA